MRTRTLAAICLLTMAASTAFAEEGKPLPPCQPTAAKPATTAQAGTQTTAPAEPDKAADATTGATGSTGATSTQVNAPADGGLQKPDRRVVMNTGQVTGNPAVKCKPVSPPVPPVQ